MATVIRQGDLVLSKSGRDVGGVFLVVTVCDKFAYLTDGKIRKVKTLKRKNIKHLVKFSEASLNELAVKIEKGISVGNKTVYLAIRTEKEKIGG